MTDLFYEPCGVDINADPYRVYHRLRDEAPVHYNDTHDYAASRYDDVERGLCDAQNLIFGQRCGSRAHQSNIEMPPRGLDLR
ncbi:MAG TPA: hypothetical protein VIX84_09585 [Acidimicrobiales bacterium]